MKILTREQLSENRYKTDENYLICLGAILARTGKQLYTLDELFNNGDDNVVEVFRQEQEVFNELAVASFENKPVTIEHPAEFVNFENYNDLAVGFVRNVRRETIDGHDVLVGDIIITNKKAIDEIENGKKYLSCGYDCNIEKINDKYYQRNIRGNHVALCENPRAEITMIKDGTKLKKQQNFVKNETNDAESFTAGTYDILLINSLNKLIEFINMNIKNNNYYLDNLSKMMEQILQNIDEQREKDNQDDAANRIDKPLKLIKKNKAQESNKGGK